jgi:hypothetical protein
MKFEYRGHKVEIYWDYEEDVTKIECNVVAPDGITRLFVDHSPYIDEFELRRLCKAEIDWVLEND